MEQKPGVTSFNEWKLASLHSKNPKHIWLNATWRHRNTCIRIRQWTNSFWSAHLLINENYNEIKCKRENMKHISFQKCSTYYFMSQSYHIRYASTVLSFCRFEDDNGIYCIMKVHTVLKYLNCIY